jgi:hypothetical protein
MKKTHKRKLLIPAVTETNLDNTFVTARQVDVALEYLQSKNADLQSPVVCLSDDVLATHVLARIKMPTPPPHLGVVKKTTKAHKYAALLTSVYKKFYANR